MRRAASMGRRVAVVGAVIGLGVVVSSSEIAEAHFVLQSPPSWMSQDSLGLPEKLGPCGDEDDGTDAATPTGIVTAVREGGKITVTINEVIFHPGHYRIALAKTRSDLPVEPVVTVGSTPCGSAPIQSPPVFPVLADGVFVHTTPFTKPQSITLTLPAGLTCDHCTLQVIEFMAQHDLNVPGGCFYHHCADLSIEPPDAQPPGDGGGSAGAGGAGGAGGTSGAGGSDGSDAAAEASGGGPITVPTAGGAPATPSSSGCSVGVGESPRTSWPLAVVAFTALLAARRRRARR